ncbi:MAG TPA: glucoamylase family protein [Bryobacteraceae bacterium]|nr:glucoamylase family protein [Bryobacteraceae bacterium]
MKTLRRGGLWAVLLPALLSAARGDYYRHIFFDNSIPPDRYYFSEGKAFAPAKLTLSEGKLPVERKIFRTPPNALSLEWTSSAGGSWEASIRLERWRNHPAEFEGDTLFFWLYTSTPVFRAALPRIQLADTEEGFSAPLALQTFVPRVPVSRWFRVAIPLRAFHGASFHPLEPLKAEALYFLQGEPDGESHRLLIDEIYIDSAAPPGKIPAAPARLEARGYDHHIDLNWLEPPGGARRYVLYRSLDGIHFTAAGIEPGWFHRYTDYLGTRGQKVFYKITSSDAEYRESPYSNVASATTRAMTDDELVTMTEEACIRFYWDSAHPDSGTTLESAPGDPDMVATGASGFGIMALLVGAERGFITRAQLSARMRKILTFLETADRYHGAWPHFLDGRTGKTMPVFGKYDNGGDLVETAFLMQGLLAARQYLKTDAEIYRRITHLWETVEWDWYRKTPQSDFLYWHWSPDYTWRINHKLIGWNETMIVYLLAIASPTHPIPASLYESGWASGAEGNTYANGGSYYGIQLPVGGGRGGPLFFTHYSFLGLNPHGLRDKYADYFENNRNITLINRAYCMDNPHHYPGYGEKCWGLTASDGPWGYRAHEPSFSEDTGTVTPTGALAAYAYTPKESLAALKYFYFNLGDRLWDIYGPRDAFDLKEDWFARIYMGLNQAPIAVMMENERTGLIWNMFMANPEIAPMLRRTGFR